MNAITLNRREVMKHVDAETVKTGTAAAATAGFGILKLALENINATLAFFALAGAGVSGMYAMIRVYRSIRRDREAAILRHQCPRLDFTKNLSFKRANFDQLQPLIERVSEVIVWNHIRFIEDCGMDEGFYIYDICYDKDGNRKRPRRSTFHFKSPLPLQAFDLVPPPDPSADGE